jgi:hypothetical protein
MDFDVPPVVPHMIATKGTYSTVLRGFCEKIISASALVNVVLSWYPSFHLASSLSRRVHWGVSRFARCGCVLGRQPGRCAGARAPCSGH